MHRPILKHIFWNIKYAANEFEEKIVLNYKISLRIPNKRKNDWKWKQENKTQWYIKICAKSLYKENKILLRSTGTKKGKEWRFLYYSIKDITQIFREKCFHVFLTAFHWENRKYHQATRTYSETNSAPCQIFEVELFAKLGFSALAIFVKLRFRCLTGFWINLWVILKKKWKLYH